MPSARLNAGPLRIALVWEQFAPYHVDRCEAVAARLGERAEVTAVEVARSSHTYAWAPSDAVCGASKITLFDRDRAEDISRPARFRALLRSLQDQDIVILGLPGSSPDIVLLAIMLRRKGTRVIFCSDSKADDYPRSAIGEAAKRLLLKAYDGGIVSGSRSLEYYRSLGVPDEKLLPGYDTLSTGRVRSLAEGVPLPEFATRPFLFLGRFVEKKGLPILLEAFAHYRQELGGTRRLVLAGSGPLEHRLRRQADHLGIAEHLDWPGFLGPEEAARLMAGSVALVLPSTEEQWGLVVNEAVAVRLPVIASRQVGACDLLVRHGETGLVVETGDASALAGALLEVGANEATWQKMREASAQLDWFADVGRFVDAVEMLALTESSNAEEDLRRLREALDY